MVENKVDKKRLLKVKKATCWGVCINSIQGVVKIVGGHLGQSHSLVADGVHSLSDLVVDIFVYFASYFGGKTPDSHHPYGHGKIETLSTILLAILLITVSLAIIVDASHAWAEGDHERPHLFVLIISFFSIVANEWLYHYMSRAAKAVDSELLLANAWHHRSDAGSSLVVLVGVTGALMGMAIFDFLAAILIGMLIIKMAITLGLRAVRELLDTAVDGSLVEKIKKIICEIDGVICIHQLRTRTMAGQILVDVHVQVSPTITVSEGHHISHFVRLSLQKALPQIVDVVVHIDPENDEKHALIDELPPRKRLVSEFNQACHDLPYFEAIKNYQLHYLNNQIHIDIYLPMDNNLDKERLGNLQQKYQKACESIESVGKISLFIS